MAYGLRPRTGEWEGREGHPPHDRGYLERKVITTLIFLHLERKQLVSRRKRAKGNRRFDSMDWRALCGADVLGIRADDGIWHVGRVLDYDGCAHQVRLNLTNVVVACESCPRHAVS
jgi:hypothetical protein